ncbi:MAG: O-antigen ligase family protein [Myxococcales bacterium]|nr:O-antigen ligase family protein [Myxococcales bacterium]
MYEGDAAIAPRWLRICVGLAAGLSIVGTQYLGPLMEATGLLGGWLTLLMFSPLYAAALGSLRRELWRGSGRWLLLLVGLLMARALTGAHLVDGINKGFSLATLVAWAAVLEARPSLMGLVAKVGATVTVAAFLGHLAAPATIEMPKGWLALFAVMYFWHPSAPRLPGGGRLVRVGLAFFVLGIFVASTFRTPVFAMLAGLVLVALREREARFVLVLGGLVAFFAMALAPQTREVSYGREVNREDLMARYNEVGNDRMSGRVDFWENALTLMHERPATWVVGVGPSEVDYFMAEANPTVYSEARGERAVHTHNTLLELVLGLGLVGPLVFVGWVLSLVGRFRWASAEMGLLVAILASSMADVVLVDLTGGTFCYAALLVLGLGSAAKVNATAAAPRLVPWGERRGGLAP